MKAVGKQIFRFEGFEVDPAQGCLRLNGKELPVRQKALQALLYLLARRHRLVIKDELIESIWEGLAVTDDALVHLIKEVRQALSDDPREPRFIKTIPRTGYRFVGAVDEFYIDVPAAFEIERTASLEVEYEEEITDEARQDRDTETRRWVPRLAASSSHRIAIAVATVAILILAGFISLYVVERSRRSGQSLADVTLPKVAGKKTLAVMHFENLSGSREYDWLREGLTDMLITDLSRSSKLTVLGRQQLHLLIDRLGRDSTNGTKLDEALQIAQSSRAEVLVLGSFVNVGDAVHITVQLYDTSNNHTLASERIEADKPKYLISQVDLLSLKLASHLVASGEGSEPKRGLTDVMTNNLQAYRYYSLGLENAEAYHTDEAIRLWEQAIVLDPEFAMAYARIGYAYTVFRINEPEKGKPYLEKAFHLSHRLTDKDKLYINAWYAHANQDIAGGIRWLREIVSEYPLEVEAYMRLGYLLVYVERQPEAIDVYKQALVVDPEAKEIHNALGFACSNVGRYDEAVAAHQRYVQLAPEEPNAHDSLGMTFNEAGRHQEAIVEFERALTLNPRFHFAHLHLGDVYFLQGRYAEAIAQYRRFLEVAPSDWDRATGYHRLTLLYLKKGDLQRAETAAKQELRNKNDFGGLFLISLARGDLQRADRLKEQLLGSSNDAKPDQLTWKWVYYFRGCYALRIGRAADAIEQFKEALRRPPLVWNVDGVEDCLADAYLELGRFDEAIAEYERVLGIRPNYPLAHYHLGQAYERKGDADRARVEHERFLQIWKDADSDIPEVVAAKKRLASQS